SAYCAAAGCADAPRPRPFPTRRSSDLECVRGLALGTGQRASFLVFNDLRFSYSAECTLVLQQTSPDAMETGDADFAPHARVLWEGKRGADRREIFRLLRVDPR